MAERKQKNCTTMSETFDRQARLCIHSSNKIHRRGPVARQRVADAGNDLAGTVEGKLGREGFCKGFIESVAEQDAAKIGYGILLGDHGGAGGALQFAANVDESAFFNALAGGASIEQD